VALQILAERHPNVLVVAAAGNSGHEEPSWPAAFPEVIAVASLTASLQPSTWSNRGPWVDCSTVGEGVVSTYVPGQESEEVDKEHADLFGPSSWAIGTGTSFAAPQIVGALADSMAASPGLTARQARLRPRPRPRPGRLAGGRPGAAGPAAGGRRAGQWSGLRGHAG
jgi:thermitase